LEVVLEKARRANGQWRVDARNQGPQVADVLRGQLRLLEGVGDAVVREIGVGDVRQVVSFHEAIEDIGGQNRRGRYRDPDVGEFVRAEPGQDFLTDADEARGLAAKSTAADTAERVLRTKELAIEAGNVVHPWHHRSRRIERMLDARSWMLDPSAHPGDDLSGPPSSIQHPASSIE